MKTKLNTTVLSARVPVDVAEMIKTASKNNGMSTSDYLTHIMTMPSPIVKKGKGGAVSTDVNPPTELVDALALFGGSAVGLLTWNIMQAYLPKDKFKGDQRDAICMLASIGAGMITFIGLMQVENKRK